MTRFEMSKTHKLAYAAILGMEGYVRRTLDPTLKDLVALRASLLNDCRYCIAMHTRDAGKRKVSQERIDAVADWPAHEALFTERERIAFELTDALTRVHGEDSVPDELWQRVLDEFGQDGAGHLLMAIATINVWNRIAIPLRLDPESLA